MQDDRNSLVPEKKRRKRKISAAVMLALDAFASGRARTISEAASIGSVSANWLARMLKRPEVGVLVDEMAKKSLRMGKLRASGRLIELLDHDSGRVSLEASRLVLAVGGISAPRDGMNISVDINAQVGYVIDLSGSASRTAPPMIDLMPNAEHASDAALVPSRGYER